MPSTALGDPDGFMSLTWIPSLDKVAARIARLGLDVRSFKVPLKKSVKDVIIPSILKNFAVGGRPAWAPYSQTTIDMHQELGEDLGSLLIRSGSLMKTMGYQNTWTISSTEASFNDLPSSVWYGRLHQSGYGGTGGNGPIPARPFAMFQAEDLPAIDKIFADWLDQRIEQAYPRGL